MGLGVENNKILSEELHKPRRKKFPRRKIIVNHIDEIFAADLVELQKFAKLNKGYRYLLTCIDIFSKYSWVIPLKDKKGINVKNALEKIFISQFLLSISYLFNSKCTLRFFFKRNKGYRYLLTCIDIFSKYSWIIPLKDKKGINVKNALEKIFIQRSLKFLWTDRGKQFYNKQVQDLLNENNIKLYSTNNYEIKSSVIERFNRNFKNMMYKKFTENNNTIFYIIDDLVNKYNNKYHSTIKMTPVEGSKKINEKKIKNVYNFEKTKKLGKFKIGDRVRISLEKNIFEKSYDTNWTEEIFIIYDIKYSNVPYYYLKDLNGDKIEGSFYEQELQKTNFKKDDEYIIEKVLKTKNDKAYVKWRNYDSSFNSWVNLDDIKKHL